MVHPDPHIHWFHLQHVFLEDGGNNSHCLQFHPCSASGGFGQAAEHYMFNHDIVYWKYWYARYKHAQVARIHREFQTNNMHLESKTYVDRTSVPMRSAHKSIWY